MIGDIGLEEIHGALGDGPSRTAALAGVAECVLAQIERPYPCSERQTLTCEEDLELPRLRFPAFYGSFDWHSCVHSHWTLVRMLCHGYLEGELREACAEQLERTFEPSRMAAEAESWRTKVPAYEEKPYGWTWLLALDAELLRLSGSPDRALAERARAWREACGPLTAEMRRRVDGWLARIDLACRSGVHSDTAWSLAMAHDYACAFNDAQLKGAVEANARRLYLGDVAAPVAYEPNADTFTSAILNEAALMARALPEAEYGAWLRGYLPQLWDEGFSSPLIPDLPGRWDGEGYLEVHTVALPCARGLAARDAAAALPQGAPARRRLAAEAARWCTQGVEDVQLSGYLADHWVGSFVCASLLG
ncbi:MAG: DUF2891 family protein [Coriobacteriia bacterium]|nr:DUF2891 family protein [Coriobacteriia bacterium]